MFDARNGCEGRPGESVRGPGRPQPSDGSAGGGNPAGVPPGDAFPLPRGRALRNLAPEQRTVSRRSRRVLRKYGMSVDDLLASFAECESPAHCLALGCLPTRDPAEGVKILVAAVDLWNYMPRSELWGLSPIEAARARARAPGGLSANAILVECRVCRTQHNRGLIHSLELPYDPPGYAGPFSLVWDLEGIAKDVVPQVRTIGEYQIEVSDAIVRLCDEEALPPAPPRGVREVAIPIPRPFLGGGPDRPRS